MRARLHLLPPLDKAMAVSAASLMSFFLSMTVEEAEGSLTDRFNPVCKYLRNLTLKETDECMFSALERWKRKDKERRSIDLMSLKAHSYFLVDL